MPHKRFFIFSLPFKHPVMSDSFCGCLFMNPTASMALGKYLQFTKCEWVPLSLISDETNLLVRNSCVCEGDRNNFLVHVDIKINPTWYVLCKIFILKTVKYSKLFQFSSHKNLNFKFLISKSLKICVLKFHFTPLCAAAVVQSMTFN